MKLSKFANLVKNGGRCAVLHVAGSGIWLSTGTAIYRATELPDMEGSEQVRTVLDMTADAWKKVYLAGKITGDPNYREKFAAAAKKLEERAGVTVISPAVTPEGLKKADYMRICFAMLESADTAVFLPDWEDSPGAQLEKHWCEYVGKKMVFLMEGAE